LRLLKITKEDASEEIGITEIVSSNISRARILVILVEIILETVIPNSMVQDSEWFDGD